jgi:hypothetical protein
MADYACPGNRKSKNDKRAKSRYNVYQTGGSKRVVKIKTK